MSRRTLPNAPLEDTELGDEGDARELLAYDTLSRYDLLLETWDDY